MGSGGEKRGFPFTPGTVSENGLDGVSLMVSQRYRAQLDAEVKIISKST